MTTAQILEPTHTPPPDDSPIYPEQDARISFRQPVSTTGFIDAAWWPRSRDLATELPPLLDVLWTADREITRVTYNTAAWDPAPRQVRLRSRTVHLGGFTSTDPITVRLSDAWGRERIDVLVIDPATDADVARRVLLLAGRSGSLRRAEEILAQANDTTELDARS